MNNKWMILLLACLSGSVAAQNGPDPILKAIDEKVTFLDHDYAAELTIVQSKPDQGQTSSTVTVLRRDREAKYVLLYLKPDSDRGKGYLKVNNSLWFYDPVSHRFQVSNFKERLKNSNASNSDFTSSNLSGDYKIVAKSHEKLGVFDTDVYDLEATNDSPSYPKCRIWVSQDHLIRKSQDMSLSGQIVRTKAITNYQKIGNQFVPVNLVIIDNLHYKMVDGSTVFEKTIITTAKPNLDPLPDLVFTQGYLEKVGQ